MQRIARFEFVSHDRFSADWKNAFGSIPVPDHSILRLPRRATKGSAGYDFFSPLSFSLAPGESILIPTCVRAYIADGWFLSLYPRSGLGFKYRFQLDNSVGIIDSDYYNAANEGHIMLRMTNDSRTGRHLNVLSGEAIAQGIFLPFGITEDDESDGIRTGGFGSTTK